MYVCMQVYTCPSGGQRQLSGESFILVSCVEFSIIIAYEIPALFLIGCSGSGRLRDTESSIYLPLKPKCVSVLRKVICFLLFLWTHRHQTKECQEMCAPPICGMIWIPTCYMVSTTDLTCAMLSRLKCGQHSLS